MKTILIIFLIFGTFSSVLPQQQDFEITEGGEAEICGKTIIVDGFRINNFETKIDLSVLTQKWSKPVTGGYSKSDTLDLTNECKYFVVSALKYGINQKGKVKISSSPEVLQIHTHPAEFTMKFKEKYKFGDEDWFVGEISGDSALIEIRESDITKKTFFIKKNDVVWFGEYAFSVTSFTPTIALNDDSQGKIELKKVRDYSYINFPVIPGEMINRPHDMPASGEELIIRKMKYYPKMKIDKEELENTPVKYWVLKIYYYNRNIASQMIKITRDGKDKMVEFTGYKSFDTEEEVMEFARINNISDIDLKEK